LFEHDLFGKPVSTFPDHALIGQRLIGRRLEGGRGQSVPGGPLFIVTTGLDPVVHANLRLTMDCRIKSGNDEL
jgi:hypothetical protein